MKYKSTNALSEFSFQESSIASMELHLGSFLLDLDNVTILSTNSHNRDIQDMRANNVTVTFTNASIEQITSEGYKVYDADGNLTDNVADEIISEDNYAEVFKELAGSFLYSIEEIDAQNCKINIDTEFHTYFIKLKYNTSYVEWDHFLKKA